MTAGLQAEVFDVQTLGPFSFRWPDVEEQFESGWSYRLRVEGKAYAVRHGLGGRVVYGRWRVHNVTWLDGQVQVEASKGRRLSDHQRSAQRAPAPRPVLRSNGPGGPR